MKSRAPRVTRAHKAVVGGFAFFAAVLSSGSSTVAAAQTLKAADLVGSWAQQGEKTAHIIIQNDSTISVMVGSSMGPRPATGRWHLSGDTLIVGPLLARAGSSQKTFNPGPRLVSLKGSQMTLTKVDTEEGDHPSIVYERLDPNAGQADSTKTP